MRSKSGEARSIGVGVIGAGYWGPNLVRNFASDQAFELRWVCDLDEDRARGVAERFSNTRVTRNLDEVLNDDEVAAVAVATPAASHLEVARAAMSAGKHVLIEKPLAASYSDARALVEEAERRQLTLMCDHTYCYTPAVTKIREVIHTGVLGDVQYVDSVRVNLGLVRRDIDVLWDLAPHDLSILDFILPDGCRPQAVAAHGADPIGAGRTCVAYLILQLTGGGIAHAHVNWLSPTKIRTMMIGGSKRTLVWDDLHPTQRISIFDRGVDLNVAEDLPADMRREALISYRVGDMVAPALAEREGLAGVVAEFAGAINENRKPLTDGTSGLRVLDVLEAATASLEYKGAVVPLRSAR
jgi:predicted dehydrogenase